MRGARTGCAVYSFLYGDALVWKGLNRSYIIPGIPPIPPPIPPMGGAGGGLSSGKSTIMASGVVNKPLTEAASTNHVLTTLVGSIIPLATKSQYSPACASNPWLTDVSL